MTDVQNETLSCEWLTQKAEQLAGSLREHPMGQHGGENYGISREEQAELIRGYQKYLETWSAIRSVPIAGNNPTILGDVWVGETRGVAFAPPATEPPLYIPSPGVTVRIADVHPEETAPEVNVGDTVVVSCALRSKFRVGWLLLAVDVPGTWMEGTWCRVEPVAQQATEGANPYKHTCAVDNTCTGCKWIESNRPPAITLTQAQYNELLSNTAAKAQQATEAPANRCQKMVADAIARGWKHTVYSLRDGFSVACPRCERLHQPSETEPTQCSDAKCGWAEPCASEPADSGIIRAAEGMVLEPGEYVDAESRSRFGIDEPLRTVWGLSGAEHVWFWDVPNLAVGVTAVRRVDPKPKETTCLGCGKSFASPDHDQRCSSCVESGTGPEPVKPREAGERAIVVGSTEFWKAEEAARQRFWSSPEGQQEGVSGVSFQAGFEAGANWAKISEPTTEGADDAPINQHDLERLIEKREEAREERDTALREVAKLESRLREYEPGGEAVPGITVKRLRRALYAQDADLSQAKETIARLEGELRIERANFNDECSAHQATTLRVDSMLPVVEAARAWRAKAVPSSPRYDNAWWKLYDAVDAFEPEPAPSVGGGT